MIPFSSVLLLHFYPRPPRGGRRREKSLCMTKLQISIHALREEGDPWRRSGDFAKRISIHALREEGDSSSCQKRTGLRYFYPRPPRGGRPNKRGCCARCSDFYPRPPRGGRHAPHPYAARHCAISIHALREEGDIPVRSGGRLHRISIHALREEGDPSCARRWKIISKFLSTPSARRATAGYVLQHRWIFDFYPRPPRGGRHPFSPVNGVFFCISIHALREEGDSKNGEKHLRFCFIIKRSAQIWKSLSKNIRKNSCDLHRTA